MITYKNKKWIAQQEWSNIYFVHIPVKKHALQANIPTAYKVHMMENQAWVTLVIFKASYSRLRFFPRILSYRPFWQINLRTYIRFAKQQGVYFFTLYSNDRLAAKFGRIPGLPFEHVNFSITLKAQEITVKSKCQDRDNLLNHFHISIQRQDPLKANALHHELTDVDTIFYQRGSDVMKSTISHKRWELYAATGEIKLFGPISQLYDYERFDPIFMAARPQKAYLYPFKQIGYIFNSFL